MIGHYIIYFANILAFILKDCSVYDKACVINVSVWERNSWQKDGIAKAINNLPSLSPFIVEESV